MKNVKLISLFFVIVLLQSCGESSSKKQESSSEEKTTSTNYEDILPRLAAVYENYDEAAHLFNYKSDTTYVINFWATWCSPCVEELPYFEYLNKTYQGEKMKVILVSLDSKKNIDSKLKPFIQREKLKSHVVALTDIDYNNWIDKVNPDWDGAIPATIIYNREDYEFIGGEFASYTELDTIFQSYLKH